jgi:sugar/nucleoside kinase (ribokinase family)
MPIPEPSGDAVMDLIAFGTVFLELVFGHVPALPGPGEEVYSDEFAISCGGAVIVASAAARSGVHAGLATTLGEDLGTRVAVEYCRRTGIDLAPSRQVTGRTAGISVVVNFDGDRAFLSYLPPAISEHRDPARWLEILRQYRPAWCYLHAGRGVSDFVRQARDLGVYVALDVALNTIDSDPGAVKSCARLADVFLPNTEELLRLTGTRSLTGAIGDATSWCPQLVVKRGAQGAVVASRAGSTEVTDGMLPVEVRDRTGAGDAFAGALIGALCQGASFTEAAVAGNAAGSDTVGKLGGVGEVEVDGLSGEVPIR